MTVPNETIKTVQATSIAEEKEELARYFFRLARASAMAIAIVPTG